MRLEGKLVRRKCQFLSIPSSILFSALQSQDEQNYQRVLEPLYQPYSPLRLLLARVTAYQHRVSTLRDPSATAPNSISKPPQLKHHARVLLHPPPENPISANTKDLSTTLSSGWPSGPFAVPIETLNPHDHCRLSFPTASDSDQRGSSTSSHFFLLQILEEIVKLNAQPAGSIPVAFDVSRHDFRFKMELVWQHPMNLDLALAALQIVYQIVREGEVREFMALVVCRGMAMGRFRLWLEG